MNQGLVDATTGLANEAREFGIKIRRMENLIAHLLYLNGYKVTEVCKMMKWKRTKANLKIIKGK